MYSITKTEFGYHLVFGDFIKANEMEAWRQESNVVLKSADQSFHVFVDMRDLKPLPYDAQQIMVQGQQLYSKAGMVRSVVIVDKPATRMQFIRLAKESGIYKWERYLSANDTPDWEKKGLAWLLHKDDPDI